jgi:hypothetical protein
MVLGASGLVTVLKRRCEAFGNTRSQLKAVLRRKSYRSLIPRDWFGRISAEREAEVSEVDLRPGGAKDLPAPLYSITTKSKVF